MLLPAVVPAASPEPALVPIPGSVPLFVADAEDLGPADPATPLHLVVALRLRDEDGLRALVDAPGATVLDRATILERHAPTPEALARVVGWLTQGGLVVSGIAEDRTFVEVETTVAAAARAFHVPLREYRVGEHTLRANGADPLVPHGVASDVQGVMGFTDVPFWTHHQVLGVASAPGELVPSSHGVPPYYPSDLRNAYDVNGLLSSGFDGAGHTIAITGWGRPDQSSFNAYNSQTGLPAATLTFRDANGGSSCGTTDQLEWDMDVQMEHAMAPGASVWAYCGSSATISAMYTLVSRVVSDNVAAVISQSWGSCDYLVDGTTASVWESKFLTAAGQGQAFFTSSGDGGSRECSRFSSSYNNVISPAWPATAPHTTSAGGTRMTMSGSSYSSETAWNTCTPCSNGAYTAAGGGPSLLYSKPSWQSAPSGASKRGSPDISGVADPNTGVLVRSGGSWWQVGGTSASSPILAGIWMDIVDARSRQGNAAETLWRVGTGVDKATGFRDVTTGNIGDFSAGAGYDYATGLGSIKGAGLLHIIADPIEPPRNLAAVGGGAQVSLTWEAPLPTPDITGYKLYRGTTSASQPLYTTLTNVTSYVDRSVADGTTYHYSLRAYNGSGDGILSGVVSATTFGPPLSAPTGFTAEPGPGAGAVTLGWTPPTNDGGGGISGYRVYRNGSSSLEPIIDIGPTTTFVETGLANGTSYQYKVSALNVYGEGPASAVDSALTFGAPLSPPTSLEATGGPAGGEITLAWAAPLDDGGGAITGYRIYGASQGTPGPTDDPSDAPRILGSERWAYQMDADDHNKPSSGRTRDASGNGRDGVLSEVVSEPSRFGHGYRFAGVNDYIRVPESGVALAQGTVMMWFKQTSSDPSANRLFFKQRPGSWSDLHLYSRPQISFNTQQNSPAVTGATSIPLDTWVHLAVTWGPAGKFVYVNGQQDGWNADTTGVGTLHTYTMIGNSPNDLSTGGFVGSIDEVREYGLQLDAATIRSLMASPYHSELGALPLLAEVANVSEHVDRGLGPNETRHYRVSALNIYGEGPLASAVNATTLAIDPLAPSAVRVAAGPGAGELTLTWSPPSAADFDVIGYRVQRGAGPTALALVAELGNVTTYVDTGLANGTTYWYAIEAFDASGPGPASPATSGITFGPPRAPPASIGAAPGPARGQVSLQWTPPVDDGGGAITGYRVYRGPSPGAETLVAQTGDVLSHVDAALADNTTYWYRISALNVYGEGVLGASVVARTFGAPRAMPTGLAAEAGPTAGGITLTWAPPVDDGGLDVTAYRIYRGTEAGAETLATQVGDVTRFTDGGLANGTRYHYRLSAVNDAGEGPLSLGASAQTFGPPLAPPSAFAVAAGPGAGDLTLTWSLPADDGGGAIAGYRVYRAADGSDHELLAELADVGSFTDAGLGEGTTRSYRVSALNVYGEGPLAAAMSARTFLPPAAPASLGASAGPRGGEISLTWGAPSDDGGTSVTEYRVYGGDATDALALLATATSRQHVESALGNARTRHYAVSAVNLVGEGARSAVASATTFDVPSAPRTPSAAAGPGPGQVTLTWAPPASDGRAPVASYNVYAGSDATSLVLVANVAGTSFTEEGLADGEARAYQISAVNAAGEGALSGIVESRAPGPVNAPRNVRAFHTVGAVMAVTVVWEPPTGADAAGLSAYRIYRGASSAQKHFLHEVTLPASQLRYEDSTCVVGMLCYYHVTAVGIVGESAASTTVSQPGIGTGVASPGHGTMRPSDNPRLVGHERLVLQMDGDDHNKPANGMTRDSSLVQNHGLLTGVSSNVGRFGSGYFFDGAGDRIALTDAATGNLPDGTLMMWVRLQQAPNGFTQLYAKVWPGVSSEMGLSVDSAGRIKFHTATPRSPTLLTPQAILAFNEWTHIAVTWGDAGKRIYVDGALAAWDSDTTGVGVDSLRTHLGGDPNNPNNTGLFGQLDEVRLYDVALPQGLIQQVMNVPYATVI